MKRILIAIALFLLVGVAFGLFFRHRIKEMPYIRLRQVAPMIDRNSVKLLDARGWFRPQQFVFEIPADIAREQIGLNAAVLLEDFYANSDYVLEHGVRFYVSPHVYLDWDQAEVYVFDVKAVPMCEAYIVISPQITIMMIYPR